MTHKAMAHLLGVLACCLAAFGQTTSTCLKQISASAPCDPSVVPSRTCQASGQMSWQCYAILVRFDECFDVTNSNMGLDNSSAYQAQCIWRYFDCGQEYGSCSLSEVTGTITKQCKQTVGGGCICQNCPPDGGGGEFDPPVDP